MAFLYANNPAVQDADDGIALRLARVAELDVELQGHAALRDAARSDVALARAQAEHIEAPPEPPPPPRQQRREVLTTKPESQKDYRGLHLLVVGLSYKPHRRLEGPLRAHGHAHHR